MSADKNHEQYLEEIEIAVAETTKELMEKHNSDLRRLAKICAEKQVEVERLKEFQENDRKTIRSLRQQLAEATEEIVSYKEELDIAHFEYDKLKEEIKELKPLALEFRKMADDYDNLSLAAQLRKEENEELKEKIENLEATNKMMKDSIKECKEGCDGGVYGLVPHFEYDKLKEEIKELKKGDKRKLKKKVAELEKRLDEEYSDYDTEVEMRHKAEKELEELQNEHEGICSKYHADLVELEEKREEVKKLKEREFRMCEIANANGWDIYPTDSEEEIEIEKVFGVSEEVFKKLMKECPPDPDDYK